jgi:hypothetical protein
LASGLPQNSGALPPFVRICFCIAGPYIFGCGIWLLSKRRAIQGLRVEAEICKHLGVTQDVLKQIVEERDIKPRCNLNSEDYYDLADFGDAVTLLRASTPPLAPQEMLRPVFQISLPPEELLRATHSEADEIVKRAVKAP